MTIDGNLQQADAGSSCRAQRADRGLRAWQAGMAAERRVATSYDRRGADLMETRWRGEGGEIDLILREGAVIVFCEVKAARSFDAAIARLRPAQVRRIHAAAAEYLGHVPAGQLAEVRFDLAVVDQSGAAQIIENAFGHF
ncbi:MAG: YraN family protein [Pseudomonadota bacterium]|uniref:YraN family protein n=1 Tax=Roseovarius TaxID=74030 RepID=UPI0022A87574|nr:YraN family protein [Roseovarius sp. EGI FJ00037]MCZ0813627.1 YraN family protein [Roseovarius sp. EGI FJ00037]